LFKSEEGAMKVGVVDYNAGNLTSVETALAHLGADYVLSKDPKKLIGTDKLIFPGVGHAGSAMENLKALGMDDMIKEFFTTGKDILGICIGSQILLDKSDEGDTICLGLIPGIAKRFPDQAGYKVPHMGWNHVKHGNSHKIFQGIPENSSFYFVHTYYPAPSETSMGYSETEYMIPFTSTIGRENLVATQFHPEKSGEVGLRLIANFLEVG
jgi:glutamine amidotransferase